MYSVKYHKQVVKFLQKQDSDIRLRVVNFFDSIKNHPTDFKTYDVKPMKGFQNRYRLRIGKYRIIFSILDDEMLIEAIGAGSRGDVYKYR